jgi:DNA-binding transcriptional regulator YhcF (GntR family)
MEIDKPVSGGSSSARARSSAIEFRLDQTSGLPLSQQLVQQVEHALRLGHLQPGDQLPKVRDAVASLAINPNTVLKAYRELELKGLAEGRPGRGTFITAGLTQVGLPELSKLRRSLLAWMKQADRTGVDADGMAALFASALRDFGARRDSGGAESGESEAVA